MRIFSYGATDTCRMIAARLCCDHDITIINERDRLSEKFSARDVSHVTGSGSDHSTCEPADSR